LSVIIDGTAGITFPVTAGSASAVQASSGRVLQVVNATYSTSAGNSTSTYADTGLSASITPSSSSNKILILINQSGLYKISGNNNNSVNVKLQRGSTDILVFARAYGYTGSALDNISGSASCCYLDSPSTTSSITYKTQFANFTNSASVTVQANGESSTITLMEIAA
jgi:hypothetical protein